MFPFSPSQSSPYENGSNNSGRNTGFFGDRADADLVAESSWYQVKHLFDDLQWEAPELYAEALDKSLRTLIYTKNQRLQISILVFLQEYAEPLFFDRFPSSTTNKNREAVSGEGEGEEEREKKCVQWTLS